MAAKKTANNITETTPNTHTEIPQTAAKKAATKTAPAAKKVPAKKAVATKAAANSATAPAAKKTSTAKPSLDAVARAAYLNYRRRVERGLPGDSHGDWLEAERQFNELR